MKGRNMLLGWMLLFSGLAAGFVGVVIRFIVLEPIGIQIQEPIIALPFVLFRDDGLRYVITDLHRTEQVSEPLQPTTIQNDFMLPTEVIVPQRNPLENVLFIGDSRTCGLRDHARLEGADYFCEVGMSVFNAGSRKLSDEGFQNTTLAGLLAEREYSCVIISLGLNEAGYPLDSLLHAYKELLYMVYCTQPQALIAVHGVLPVSQRWIASAPYLSPQKISTINAELKTLAQQFHVGYLDGTSEFADPNGYLPEKFTADGCHFYAMYSQRWADWIYASIRKLDS